MRASTIFAVVTVIVSFSIIGTKSTVITINNNCPYKIWPATQKNSDSTTLEPTGFEVESHQTFTLNPPADWAGRIWARTQCTTDGGVFKCAVGDCGPQVPCNGAGGAPPVSLAEFKLNGFSGLDNYDISLVDGSSIRLSIQPQGKGAGCRTTSCLAQINDNCPAQLAVKGPNGETIACNSACNAFHKDEDCCTGAHNTSDTCQPSISSKFFKQQCPDAYSYAFDDRSSLPTCPTGGDFLITFCP